MARLVDNRDEFNERLDIALKRAFKAIGLQLERNAVIEINKSVYDTPESPNYKRTGRLRSSITHRSDSRSATVGTNVEYAPFVEFGTSKGKGPRPYIRPAVENHLNEYENILNTELKDVGDA